MSFAYAETIDHADLSDVRIDEELLAGSSNFQLTVQGLVYPTYYSKLYPDLRNALTATEVDGGGAERAAGRDR